MQKYKYLGTWITENDGQTIEIRARIEKECVSKIESNFVQ